MDGILDQPHRNVAQANLEVGLPDLLASRALDKNGSFIAVMPLGAAPRGHRSVSLVRERNVR